MDTTTTGQKAVNIGREWSPFVFIPGNNGAPYKAESKRDGVEPGTLERFTVWLDDDPRDDPHTHPWPFVSTILSGGYRERRYRKVDGIWRCIGERIYSVGDFVAMPADEAHVVFGVWPGTTTHMKIGQLTAGPRDWGHIIEAEDAALQQFVPATATPEFLATMAILNKRPQ